MEKNKSTYASPKGHSGKGSLKDVKTNEDFNKEKPYKDDPALKIKKVNK